MKRVPTEEPGVGAAASKNQSEVRQRQKQKRHSASQIFIAGLGLLNKGAK